MRGLRQERYQEINVELLRKVVRSPSWTPDHRFVLLSSVSALGPSLASNPLNESAAPTPVGFYGTSKLAGERVLQEEDFPARWLILRPPSLYGPGDPCFLDVFRLAGRGLYPALGARSLQFQLVFVADLVEAMRAVTQVLDSASSLPPILHLGNPQVLTHEDWRREFQGVHGHAVRALYLGTWGTRLLGWMGAGKELVTGTPELTGPDKATHLLAGDWVHDLSGFDAVMGERAWTSLETGTRLTHRWYEDHGWYAR
jgi:nucleoside-diphosphate-sugar epimerase